MNKFVARAAGGVFFYSNSTSTAGVKLTAGANAWAAVSDRNAKTDLVRVAPRDVLKRVAAVPVSTWTYKSEPSVRHMGPMAQDFYAAFGLGTDDRSIVTVDADGVALAAIQGLNEKTIELEATVVKLAAENEELRKRVDRLDGSPASAHANMMFGGVFGFGALGVCLAGALFGRQRRERRPIGRRS